MACLFIDMNKQESKQYEKIVKPFNTSVREYVSCREKGDECKDKKVFSGVSNIYDKTRVEKIPSLKKIEFSMPPSDPPPPRNKEPFVSYNYKAFDSEDKDNSEKKEIQTYSNASNNYSNLFFTVLATTTIYYFFFKLSK